MGQIRVGAAGWADKLLIDSGWYPADPTTPTMRLRYYAGQFPLVEVDSAYYALPAERTAEAWRRGPGRVSPSMSRRSAFYRNIQARMTDLAGGAQRGRPLPSPRYGRTASCLRRLASGRIRWNGSPMGGFTPEAE
jgi:hypothetical protein